MTPHYYNENDQQMAAWLRELIRGGLIPEGDVDDRSILDVSPDDLRGYVACHFFAGIGGWAYALRLAGWPDDRPVWTGSPPCQPFSTAGQRRARDDDRHLAPAFLGLVRACRPPVLFGEQVASASVVGRVAGRAKRSAAGPPEWSWADDLQAHLEAAHYAVGAADLPAAGVGAPHIRQRLFFGAVRLDEPGRSSETGGLGDDDNVRRAGRGEPRGGEVLGEPRAQPAGTGSDCRLAHGLVAGLEGHAGHGDGSAEPGRQRAGPDGPVAEEGDAGRLDDTRRGPDERQRGPGEAPRAPESATGEARERQRRRAPDRADGAFSGVADSDGWQPRQARSIQPGREHGQQQENGGVGRAAGDPDTGWPNAPHDPWRDADWLFCRDGKWRPVESSLLGLAARLPEGVVRSSAERSAAYPLSEGTEARVIRLRGYGNAIVPQAAAAFVEAFSEACSRMGAGSDILE